MKTPDGKRVTMSVKLSEGEALLVDAARGNASRSEWLRGAALAALGIPESRHVAIGGFEIPVVVDDSMPPGRIGLVSAWAEDGEVKTSAAVAVNIAPEQEPPKPKRCRHPRVHGKGVCPDCHDWVASK